MKQPMIIHCKRCNRILSYIKRHPVEMCFVQLTGSPIRVVGMSDSAYKIEEDETRALAGHMIVMMAGRNGASALPSKQPQASIAGPELCFNNAPAFVSHCEFESNNVTHSYLKQKGSPFGPCVLIDYCCRRQASLSAHLCS